MRRRLVVVAVRNAEPAADIDMVDAVAVGAQHAHEIREQRECLRERLELGDLAADMHVDARHAHAGQLGGARVDLARAADRNPELILGSAGRDFGMGARVDIGIDPHRDGDGPPFRRGDFGEQRQLGLGFDVDAENAFIDSKRELLRTLADPGEHDAVRRNARRHCPLELAFGYHVGPRAQACQRGDDGLIGIRLHGVAD